MVQAPHKVRPRYELRVRMRGSWITPEIEEVCVARVVQSYHEYERVVLYEGDVEGLIELVARGAGMLQL